MDHPFDQKFKDILLARRYLWEQRESGSLTPELQATVDERGAEHIGRLAQIISNRDAARGYIVSVR
jgi:hypothetical protein